MKFLTAVFVFLTFLGVFSSRTSFQPSLSPTLTLKDKLSKTHLGNALLNMVDMGNKANADFDQLFEAFTLLKESLQKRKDAELDDYDEDEGVHKAQVAKLSRLINQYKGSSIQFQDELEDLQAEGNLLNGNLKKQQGQLKTAQSQQESEESIIEKLAATFEQQSTDYTDAIQLLGEAVDKLKQAQNASSDAFQGEAGNFLEVNKTSFVTLGQKLQKQLKTLNASQVVSRPISLFFSQLTNAQPDDNTIGRAIQALKNLKSFYQDGLTELEKDFQEDTANHTTLLNAVKVQIGNLENNIIPKSQSAVEANDEAQTIRQSQVTQANRDQRISENNLEEENTSWGKRVEQHELLIPQYDSEFDIVTQAEALLKQQQ